VKEVFGTDQYQIRSARRIWRFWHLAFLAYLDLEEQRATLLAPETDPALTIGQTRWEQQKRHRRLLLDWIGIRYADGVTSKQIDQLLAA
jgi:hypothetical protein